jgi:hypothetical protein
MTLLSYEQESNVMNKKFKHPMPNTLPCLSLTVLFGNKELLEIFFRHLHFECLNVSLQFLAKIKEIFSKLKTILFSIKKGK